MLWLITFALFILGVISQPNDRCHPPNVCKPDFLDDLHRVETMFPGKEFFESNCEGIVSFTDCLVDLTKECGELIQTMNFDRVQELVHEICEKNSPLRKAYEENVDCVNGLREDFQELGERMDKLIRRFLRFLRAQDIEVDHQAMTCAVTPILASEVADVVEKCGKNAKDTAVEVLRPSLFLCTGVDTTAYEMHLATFLISKLEDDIEDEFSEEEEEEEEGDKK